MIRNYFKIAWRNLVKSKAFSIINIAGLTTGITVCMMIFLFVMHEFSYDNFHTNGKNIYRLMRTFDPNSLPVPYVSGPYAAALKNDFSHEIEHIVRVMPDNDLFTYNNRPFNEKKVLIADSNFFSFFTFPLLRGNPATVLADPGSVVLTETAAKKYFGNEDPIGKILDMNTSRKLRVTGIAKDVPSNSHLDFDVVISFSIYKDQPWMHAWLNNDNFTYVMLDPHVDPTAMQKRFPAFENKYLKKVFEQSASHWGLALRPLREIYFEPTYSFDESRHGDKKVVYVFLSIAALILVIACINFMNLSTIRAAERSKEVGLRKVMGALRNNLTWQFLGESVLMTVISCALAVCLLIMLMPVYDKLLGYTLEIPYNQWYLYGFLLGTVLVVGLLAGSYPALILSRFSPIEALKGKLKSGKGGTFFRHALVVVQFSISVFLITGTLIINKQMHFVKSKQLGYNQDQAMVIRIDNGDIYSHMKTFKQELQANSNIAAVSMMSGEPGGFFDTHSFQVEGLGDKAWQGHTEFADADFVKTLGLKIIAGRDLSKEYATDSLLAVLINREAAQNLGWTPQQALGKWIKDPARDSLPRRVVGVVDNFNYSTLKDTLGPLVISPGMDRRVAIVRLRPGDIQNDIAIVKKEYAAVAPAYPFEYTFLDQKFDDLYKKDLRQQTILSIFSGLAIIIACLGLFGLASFTATKRTKEIGVRKVLGSSVRNIVLLLSKELLSPVMLATLIAIPVAYMVMSNWLQGFAYRTPMYWWIFVLAAVITVAIALITVSIKALKAALANPTHSLRSE